MGLLFILRPHLGFPGISSQDGQPVFATPGVLQVNAGSTDNWSMLAPASPHWASSSLWAKDETHHLMQTQCLLLGFPLPTGTHRAAGTAQRQPVLAAPLCMAAARCRGAGDGASFPENRNCYRPGICPERRQRASAGRERKADCRAEGRLWPSLRKRLFLRSRVSPRAGKADTHARLGSVSTAAAPPATCQQMPQSPHGRHGIGG